MSYLNNSTKNVSLTLSFSLSLSLSLVPQIKRAFATTKVKKGKKKCSFEYFTIVSLHSKSLLFSLQLQNKKIVEHNNNKNIYCINKIIVTYKT